MAQQMKPDDSWNSRIDRRTPLLFPRTRVLVPPTQLRADACHWSIMQIVEHSLAASHDGFANSCWNVWQCGPADTYQIARLVWSVLRQCERRPRCTLLPHRADFLRVAASLEAAHE